MRTIAAALAFALLASPAFAKSKSKEPRAGQFCPKASVGTTSQDAKGDALECKASKKGKARWAKK
jgi:hypothetical protein